MATFVTHALDGLSRTELQLWGRPLPAFQVCGYTGFILGLMQSTVLTNALSLSNLVLLGITGVVIMTFYGLVMATKTVTGEEQITYYHHEIAVMAMVTLFLRLTHQPLLPYLDVAILGIGSFLAFGRIGCLLVGCCHGRPWRWGVCYNSEHAAAGFAPCYVGVPLFPVQALESLWALCIVAVGTTMILRGGVSGSALTWYVIAYGAARFCLEFLRGDGRPYLLGFSEAQWISLILMTLVVYGEMSGTVPCQRWHSAIAIAVAVIMAGVSIERRFRKVPTHRLLHPRHIREIAESLDFAVPSCARPFAVSSKETLRPWIRVGRTSLGVQISGCVLEIQGHFLPYYALSSSGRPLTTDTATVLADLICRLRHPHCDFDLFCHTATVSHFVVLCEGSKQLRRRIQGIAYSKENSDEPGSGYSEQ